MYLFPSELVSLPGRRCGRFGREGGMRTAAGNTHQPAHNLVKSEEKKTFAFIILMSFLSEPSPIHALYFCSCFAFLSNGDEERGAAAKLAEMIGKTDHEDGKKEIFLFILDFVSVFFWELFQYLNA